MPIGSTMKRILLGRPVATAEEMQERLPNEFALPVFAADAISSTAYGSEGWRRRAAMNGIGAVLTGVVTLVVLVTKFLAGAYIVLIAVAVLIAAFYTVQRHYRRVATFLEPQNEAQLERLGKLAISRPRTTVVLFVSQVNELTARSLALGRGLSPDDFHAVTIANDPERVLALQERWIEMDIDIPLVVVDSPYREFTRPSVEYVKSLKPSARHTVTAFTSALAGRMSRVSA